MLSIPEGETRVIDGVTTFLITSTFSVMGEMQFWLVKYSSLAKYSLLLRNRRAMQFCLRVIGVEEANQEDEDADEEGEDGEEQKEKKTFMYHSDQTLNTHSSAS